MIIKILKLIVPPIFFKKSLIPRLFGIILINVYRLLQRKGKSQLFYDELLCQINKILQIKVLFPEEKMEKHYVYEPMRITIENPDLYIGQIRYYRVYDYFKKNYPKIFEQDTKILNVGDTSGILLEAIGKKGTSLSINQECVNFMERKGLKAVLGNAENLPFEDKSFDYIFCFQCIEHIPNPLKVLDELGRVVKEKVFISVPYTENTIIYNLNYWINLKKDSWREKDVKNVDCHIFEFSTDDFKNILSYTSLEYEINFPIYYFDNDSFIQKMLNKYRGSYYNFFVLKPKEKKKVEE